ncbi:MAG: hypothetical protein RSG48_01360 [Clostridia bacterium]
MNEQIYSTLFPIWFQVLLPSTFIFSLPLIFLLDTLIFIIVMYILKLKNKKQIYKKVIIKIFGVSIISYAIGAIILVSTQFIKANNITAALVSNVFANKYSLAIMSICVMISALCIYFLNKEFSFKKLDIDIKTKIKIALVFAIVSAPYIYFIPTKFSYITEKSNIVVNSSAYAQKPISKIY